jgi:hypothetical protein
MTVDEMIYRWAAKKVRVPLEDVLDVEFRHEDGWTSEAGTGWPEENYAVIRFNSPIPSNPTRVKEKRLYVPGVEDVPDLLNEILSFAELD